MEFTRVDVERRIMSETVVEKTWEIPAHGGKGPVTVMLPCLVYPRVGLCSIHIDAVTLAATRYCVRGQPGPGIRWRLVTGDPVR